MNTDHANRLLMLCDDIAYHDGFLSEDRTVQFNDGVDCEYEYRSGGVRFRIELLRDHGSADERYSITVKRWLHDDVWFIESESDMVAAASTNALASGGCGIPGCKASVCNSEAW